MRLKNLREKPDAKCPECGGREVQKKGFRKSKREWIQKYRCKGCGRYFVMKKMLHKSYPTNVILNAISLYNRGMTLGDASKRVNMRFGVKTYPRLISAWMNEFSDICTFRRFRKRISKGRRSGYPDPVLEKLLEHRQPYLYKYHKLKMDMFLTDYFRGLKNYLLNITKTCPHELFLRDNIRSSYIRISAGEGINIEKRENYACKLAGLALKMTRTNRERHGIVQDFMLVNDTSTLAAEVPVWLTRQETGGINSSFGVFPDIDGGITGHIDLVQARFGLIYVLDYKPEAERVNALSQLFTYALAMSVRTGVWLRNFRCAWFDERGYYEFNPNHIILNIASARGIHVPEEERRKYILNEGARSYYTSLRFHEKRKKYAGNFGRAGKVTDFSGNRENDFFRKREAGK